MVGTDGSPIDDLFSSRAPVMWLGVPTSLGSSLSREAFQGFTVTGIARDSHPHSPRLASTAILAVQRAIEASIGIENGEGKQRVMAFMHACMN